MQKSQIHEDNQQVNTLMNIKKLSWLAGLWEGEGSISVFRNRRENGKMKLSITISIVNTDPTLILEVLKVAKEIGVNFHLFENKHKNPRWATSYSISCRRLDGCKKFIEAISPHMIGQKKQIAELALMFVKSRINLISQNRNMPNTEKEKEISNKIYLLNKKGVTKSGRILNDYMPNAIKR